MTPAQRELARHALGLGAGRRISYRNYFAPARGTAYHDAWTGMVDAGQAEYVSASPRIVAFRMTPKGAEAALAPGERLDPEDFPPPDPAPAEVCAACAGSRYRACTACGKYLA